MSSVKATAASRSGELILYYELLYAFNLKFWRRDIIVDSGKWIEDSTLVSIETIETVKRSSTIANNVVKHWGIEILAPVDQILPQMRLMHPSGVRGKAPGQNVRGLRPFWSWRYYDVWNTNFSALFHLFYIVSRNQVDIKTVSNRYYNANWRQKIETWTVW